MLIHPVAIPLTLPEAAIMSRLGANRHLTHPDAATLARCRTAMRRAFVLCRAVGCCTVVPLLANDGEKLRLDDGVELVSRELARLVGAADALWFGAVTVGAAVVEAAAAAVAAGELATAAIYDATGSECADLAIGQLQRLAGATLRRQDRRLSERRFSPGYGGLALSTQGEFFKRLPLRELGMTLTERFIIIPEKSVTALAAIHFNRGETP